MSTVPTDPSRASTGGATTGPPFDAPLTIPNVVGYWARNAAATEAVVDRTTRITYERLEGATADLARGLLARGIGKGDHVGVLMPNRLDWILSWLATNRIGAVTVGISTWSSRDEFEYVIRHSDSRALILTPEFRGHDYWAMVTDICPSIKSGSDGNVFCASLPFLRTIMSTEEIEGVPVDALTDLVEIGRSVPSELLEAAQDEVRPEDVALLLYTSGSTGTPKGVQLLQGPMIANAWHIGTRLDFLEGDRYWLPLPLFWSAGSANSSMVALTHGGTIVLQESFEATEALRLLDEERCSHYFAFPNVTAALYNHPDRQKRRLSNAKVAVSTGNPEALRMLREMGFSKLCHPYGTTEDYGFATTTDLDDPVELLYESQGHPLPGMELRILDPDTGDVLEGGQTGEICLRGRVTPGYYKDQDKNRAAFDESGYFHTRDLGYLDGSGRLHFMGRLSELIKSSGMNVSPSEVEAVLLSHPDVVEAYVVGVPDPWKGELVVAAVKRATEPCTDSELLSFCRDRLSSYKVPVVIKFRDSFPLTDTGKVSKRVIGEEIAARLDDATGS